MDDAARPWWHGVGSPGVPGYVLAVAVSDLVFALLLPGQALLDGDLQGYAFVALLAAVFSVPYCIPLAVPGVLLVHLVCLRVTSQVVHVVTAGLVGATAGWVLWAGVLGETGFPLLAPAIATATAVGRAAVIPMARKDGLRRALRPAGPGSRPTPDGSPRLPPGRARHGSP